MNVHARLLLVISRHCVAILRETVFTDDDEKRTCPDNRAGVHGPFHTMRTFRLWKLLPE